MARTRFALWKDRALRLWLTAATSALGALGSIARNKWLALHLEPAGLGVLGQVLAGQTWLGTATGLGLSVPVTRAVGEAAGRSDEEAVRRILSTALRVLAPAALTVAVLILAFAPQISILLLGTAEHAHLVRISALAVGGLAFQGTLQALFAGYSDVRSPFTYALAGNLVTVSLVLALVPRFGLAGAVWAVVAFWPVAVAVTLWVHRKRYAHAFTLAPRFDRAQGRSMLRVAGASLLLALLDQGTLLGLRAHYVRAEGLAANGLLQAALALSQQLGSVFYSYLGGYAFGKISGAGGLDGIRAYTRKQWVPLVALAACAFAVVQVLSGPLLHLLYSSRFDGARAMVGWMMLGEFGKVCVLAWALGALPLAGVRLWFPIGAAWPLGMAAGYLAARLAGLTTLALPVAYASAGFVSLAFAGALMSSRGVTLDRRGLAVGFAAYALLFAAAWFLSPRGAP